MNYYPASRKMPRTADERFFERVERGPGCWEWVGRKFHDGYGVFSVGRASVRAHRWAYERFVGPIPPGLVIDHLCRNRSCVNPEHLEPVTNAENLRRSPYSPSRRTHCPQGHEYDKQNTYLSPSGDRKCRACGRRRAREKYAALDR